jgi:LPXTG-motif cell wall-anchored protein
MSIVDSVLSDSRLTSSYFLDVIRCDDGAIVYNTQRGGALGDSLDVNTCNGLEYPKSCYKVALTFYGDVKTPVKESRHDFSSDGMEPSSWMILMGSLLLVFSGYAYFKRKKEQTKSEHIIPIGAYLFDQRNMHLTFNGETVELTSKEADLLFLLHSSKNETVERDTILRIVWGDDGDYVGRTLDVFISKLRKKLSGDPAIKIANIRGVGYRLVVDVADQA